MTNKSAILVWDNNSTLNHRLIIKHCIFDTFNNTITDYKGKTYEPINYPLILDEIHKDPLIILGLYNTAKIKFNTAKYKNKAFLLDCLVLN